MVAEREREHEREYERERERELFFDAFSAVFFG